MPYDLRNVTVYLASMAIINGAKTKDDVMRTVKGGFMNVMRVRPENPSIFLHRGPDVLLFPS